MIGGEDKDYREGKNTEKFKHWATRNDKRNML